MLILTRKKSQSIVIGDDIRVTVVRVKGGAVKLGVRAPNGIKVLRSEVLDAIAASANETDSPKPSVE